MNGVPPLVDRLEVAARDGGGRVVFHAADGAHPIDAAGVYDMARRRASVLRDRGVGVGDRVGIIGPNAPDWLAWMHATWMCGGTSVGLPIPLRIRNRTAVAEQTGALADAFELRVVAAEASFAPLLDDHLVIEWAGADDAPPLAPSELVRLDDDDNLARIVPTSGTTSLPKGVSRSYARTNLGSISTSMNPFGLDEMRYLSVAPLAHAGAWMVHHAHFYPWFEVHVLSPQRFARDPGELFRLVGPNRVLAMSASSSAVAAALRSVERRPDGVDLAGLRQLSLSYEMVDPELIDRLVDVGGAFGLRPESISTSYGLSEGGSTQTPLGQPPRIDLVDLGALATEGVARPPANGAAAKRVVSCGVQEWEEFRLADEYGRPVPERHVGEVQFRGTELMLGYVGPGAERAFADDDWMHTGDVGYLADGELFITGRIKEVIVRQGKKYHPEDIEWAAAHGADVAPDRCVAFAPLDGREGDVVVAIESEGAGDFDDIERAVRAAVMNGVGIPLHTVLFVAPQSLPKASSGKAQRLAARDRYARGELV